MSAFLNNPSGVVPISLFLDEIDHITAEEESPAKNKFFALVAALGLANDEVDGPITNVSAQKISGGITNALYIMHLDFGAHQRSMVLRLFGFGTEQFIDRKVENIVFSSLSKSGHGPTFYGLFETGRIEGYLPDVQCLEPFEMFHPKIYCPVARTLEHLHATSIPEVDMMQSDWLWTKLDLFFYLALQHIFTGDKLAQFNALNLPLMRKELAWYRSHITSLHNGLTEGDVSRSDGWRMGQRLAFQRVLCHNDLLSGNIMRPTHMDLSTKTLSDSEEPGEMTLIDYEYAGYNYRAFDIANHFCEFAGFEFKFRESFPSEATRREFIREYLAALLGDDVDAVDGDMVAGFEDIVLRFTLASDFFWGTWAVVQAATSFVDFDYLSYASLRYAAYIYHGELYLGEAFVTRVVEQEEDDIAGDDNNKQD